MSKLVWEQKRGYIEAKISDEQSFCIAGHHLFYIFESELIDRTSVPLLMFGIDKELQEKAEKINQIIKE